MCFSIRYMTRLLIRVVLYCIVLYLVVLPDRKWCYYINIHHLPSERRIGLAGQRSPRTPKVPGSIPICFLFVYLGCFCLHCGCYFQLDE